MPQPRSRLAKTLLGSVPAASWISVSLALAVVSPPPAHGAVAARAGEQAQKTTERTTAGTDTSPPTAPLSALPLGSGGLLLYFDPASGRIVERPTPAQRAALHTAIRAERARRAATLHESSRGLRSFAVPGGVGVALEGRYTSAVVLRLRPDGGFEIGCIDDPPTVETLRQTAAWRPVEKQ